MSETQFCDYCGQDLVTKNGVTGYMVPTGRIDEDLGIPVVRMVCVPCYEEPAP